MTCVMWYAGTSSVAVRVVLVAAETSLQKAHLSAGTVSHPTPYTRHSTPYTLHSHPTLLHPTPCTLHPTPNTLQPTPYTLHPTPYTLHPTSLQTAHLSAGTVCLRSHCLAYYLLTGLLTDWPAD